MRVVLSVGTWSWSRHGWSRVESFAQSWKLSVRLKHFQEQQNRQRAPVLYESDVQLHAGREK